MGNIITPVLPHDLPENWNDTQYVSPGGTEVGLTEKHGYNYLMKQVNNSQKAINELDAELGDIDTTLQNKAPAGYGLGTRAEKSVEVDFNNYINNGVYGLGGDYSSVLNAPTQLIYGLLFVTSGSSIIVQDVWMADWSSDHVSWIHFQRVNSLGGDSNYWSPWNIKNPLMLPGVEYRTDEEIGGKAVYKKNVNGVIQYRIDGETDWKPYADAVGAYSKIETDSLLQNKASIQSYSVRFYVSPSGSDTSGDGSESNPFKTIQHAANLLPNFLKFNGGATARIVLLDGTYTESVRIEHVKGWYMGSVTVEAANAKNATIDGSVIFQDCANIGIYNVKITQTVTIEACINIAVDSCDFINGDSNTTGGVLVVGSIASLYRCSISNRHDAVMALQGAIVSCFSLSGSGNVIAYNVGNINGSAAIIMYSASTIEATTQEAKTYGGQILT